jgi:MFS family permease
LVHKPDMRTPIPLPLSIVFLSLALFLATFGVNLQAPLYKAYAEASGVGAAAVTIAFACYVGGLIPTLVFLGGLSDRIGRRIPIALSLALGSLAAALLVWMPTWPAFCVARFMIGIGIGLATSTGNAYMAELFGADRVRTAALCVTSATSLGFGSGALATGVSLALGGATTFPWSFAFLLLAAPVMIMIVLALPRVDRPKPVSPLRLPAFPTGTWPFGLAIALAWSATGVTIAVVPLELAERGLHGWTGLVVFLSNFVGFLCQPLARRTANVTALMVGCALIPLGFLLLCLGTVQGVLPLVLLGAGITSSASYGFTYLGGLAEVSATSAAERARATAGYFVYAYVGFSIPVILSGLIADTAGLPAALWSFFLYLAGGNALLALILFNRARMRISSQPLL